MSFLPIIESFGTVGYTDVECLGTVITLKELGNGEALISYEGPTCNGSGVVSMTDNKLKGKIKMTSGFRNIVFNKSD